MTRDAKEDHGEDPRDKGDDEGEAGDEGHEDGSEAVCAEPAEAKDECDA